MQKITLMLYSNNFCKAVDRKKKKSQEQDWCYCFIQNKTKTYNFC